MLLKTLAFLLGIVLCLQLPLQLPRVALWAILLFSLCIVMLKSLRLIVFFLCGFIWASFFMMCIQAQVIPNSLQHKPVLIQAKIISFVKHEKGLQRFYVQSSGALDGKIKLSAYDQALPLQAGQTWQLAVTLKKPWGFANPGGFLYQDYLWTQGVVATGSVVSSSNNTLLSVASPSILSLRTSLAQQIARQGGESARFMQALSVGDRDQFTQNDWTVLQKTGTNHLVAISGLHIGLIAGLAFICMQFLWRRSRRLCLLLPAQSAGACAAIAIAIAYAALAGFSLPTQRAVIMLLVFMSALIMKRSLMSWYPFSIALLVVLILNPLSVLDSGFYLSFFAVASLIFADRGQKKTFFNHWLRPQLIVILGVTPWTVFYFHQFSLVSPLANSVTIPVVGFIIVPLCLLSCLCFCVHASGVAILFLKLAEYGMAFVWWFLTRLSHCSFASVSLGYFPAWKLVLSAVMVLMLLSALRCWYKLSVLCLLPLLFLKPAPIAEGDFRFTLLDVGQGLASVVQTAHHVLVFDTGPKFSDTFNAGSAVVIPFLQSRNISTVDKLVVSHGDSDHIGGASAIISSLKVLSISTSVPQRFQKASECLAGQHWRWDGVDFEFLYPDPQHLGLDNNSSCVLKVSNRFYSVLSTGDIQSMAERYLVAHERAELRSSVIIIPHHGSKTSSSDIFLGAVQPSYGFFPVGYLNRFHFPSEIVVKRYQQRHVRLLSTATCGAILLSVKKDKPLAPVCYRQTLPFYLR